MEKGRRLDWGRERQVIKIAKWKRQVINYSKINFQEPLTKQIIE